MKGNELKGSYDKLPISNKKDSTIKYGYASD